MPVFLGLGVDKEIKFQVNIIKTIQKKFAIELRAAQHFEDNEGQGARCEQILKLCKEALEIRFSIIFTKEDFTICFIKMMSTYEEWEAVDNRQKQRNDQVHQDQINANSF